MFSFELDTRRALPSLDELYTALLALAKGGVVLNNTQQEIADALSLSVHQYRRLEQRLCAAGRAHRRPYHTRLKLLQEPTTLSIEARSDHEERATD